MKTPSSYYSSVAFPAYVLLALLMLLAFASPLCAQDLDNATINGRVLDQNGAVIPGATVTAVRDSTNVERTVTTDDEGRYRLIQLEPGAYTLRAAANGFAVVPLNVVTIAAQNVQLDITLAVAAANIDPVFVEDVAPPVDTTRTIVGGTVTREEVESLPIATRSPLDLIFTLGGVTEEPLSTRDLAEDRNQNPRGTPEEAGSFSLSGGSASSNNITIDGLDNNDDRSARERFQPSIEAIDEVQIIRNQFSAEYGRASGGRVNLRTRGGSKKYRGRLFYFFRDESLNANTFFNNSRGLKRLPLQEQNPGFTLSGPLPLRLPRFGEGGKLLSNGRNKTFFFAAYENDTLLDSALIDTLVPVQQSSLFPLPQPTTLDGRRLETVSAPSLQAEVAPFVQSVSTPQRNNVFTARIDHTFTQSHNGTFLYQLGRLKNLRQFGGGSRLAEALQGRTRNTDALAYSDNYVFSPKFVNQLRIQFSRLTPAVETSNTASPVVLIKINDPLPPDNPANRDGTLVAGSSTTGASDRRENRFQIQNTLSYIRGAHSMKFGADIQRIRSTFIDLADASGTFNFDSAGDFLAGLPSRFRQNFQTESTQRNTYTGFFAQDEWRVRPNLTLSYGVRYENETIIRDRNNVAPRVALAYDPFRLGKTVIRLGAGIFYNRALLPTHNDALLTGTGSTHGKITSYAHCEGSSPLA